jgi:hypothetical protein
MSSIEHFRGEINSDHVASCGSKELARELTHEPESDDGNGLAQPHVRLPHTLHRDAANGGESTTFEVDFVRKTHTQV